MDELEIGERRDVGIGERRRNDKHGRGQSCGAGVEEEVGAAAPAQRRSQGTGGGGMRRVVREERGR
jgi:hypothetical protein